MGATPASTQEADEEGTTHTGVSASPVLVAQVSPVAGSKEAGKAHAAVVEAAVPAAASAMQFAGVLSVEAGQAPETIAASSAARRHAQQQQQVSAATLARVLGSSHSQALPAGQQVLTRTSQRSSCTVHCLYSPLLQPEAGLAQALS